MQPLIVTARCASEAQVYLNKLRQTYFPPERNILDAHLTILHQIPQTNAQILLASIDEFCHMGPIEARLARLHAWNTGFAVVIHCPALTQLHKMLTQKLVTCLTPQDKNKLWPHVTLQNKTQSSQSAQDFCRAKAKFFPQNTFIVAIDIWRYEQGPWTHLQAVNVQGPSQVNNP